MSDILTALHEAHKERRRKFFQSAPVIRREMPIAKPLPEPSKPADTFLKKWEPSLVKPTVSKPTVKKLVRHIAKSFDLTFDDIILQSRYYAIVHPRQYATYILRETTNLSYPDLGRIFGGQDHSTIIHAVERAEERLRANPAMATKVAQLIKDCRLIIERDIPVNQRNHTFHTVWLHNELSALVEAAALEQNVKPQIIIAECVRSYMGRGE